MSKSVEQRFWEKVDRRGDDDCWLWTASKNTGSDYGQFRLNGRMEKAHRVSWELAHGVKPGPKLDHRCLNPTCVNPRHLREVTNKQNNENRAGAYRNNVSGVRGVSRQSRGGGWRARVRHDGVLIHVGTFPTIEEAGEAARLKRLELFTHNEIDKTGI